jgi:hypothetical protein
MSGNAGGAKDADFRHAFDDSEGRVIGGEPRNASKDPGPSEEAIRQGEGGLSALSQAMKLVGELNVGNRAP